MNIDRFHFLPETDIMATKAYMVHQWRDSFWVVHPEKGLAFFDKGYSSPQCNKDESIAKRLCPEWGTIKYIDRVLAPLNINDYVDR